MSGFFHKFAETQQAPMLFEQFGEPVVVSATDEPEFSTTNGTYRVTGIVKVMASGTTDQNGKRLIISAEVLLRPRGPHADDIVRTLTSKQLLQFRGQAFRIEALGPFEAGVRKAVCVAMKKEFSHLSKLGGR